MFPIHSRGELPGVFLIEGIADHNFSSSIGSTLLKVVTIGDSIVIVTGPTSLLGTVRCFAIDSKGISIKSLQDNLFVQRNLGGNGSRIKQTE